MARKNFATSLDEKTTERFKAICSNYGINMNTVLEALIEDFCNGNYAIIISKNGAKIQRED